MGGRQMVAQKPEVVVQWPLWRAVAVVVQLPMEVPEVARRPERWVVQLRRACWVPVGLASRVHSGQKKLWLPLAEVEVVSIR